MYTVYAVVKDNKVLYVGKTVNITRRKYEHRYRRKLDNSYNFIPLKDNLTKLQIH